MKKVLARLFPVLLLGLISGGDASAASTTWQGTGSDWNTSGNWNGGVPVSGSTALFTGTSPLTVNLSGTGTTTNITFSGGSAYTITSSAAADTLNLVTAGSISSTASVAETINAPIVIGAAPGTNSYTFGVAASDVAPLIFNGTITGVSGSGTAAINLLGASAVTNQLNGVISDGSTDPLSLKFTSGIWDVSSANTFSGGVTLNGGTALIGNNSAFGSGPVTLAASSTLTGSDSLTVAGAFTDNANGFTLTNNDLGLVTLSGAVNLSNSSASATSGLTLTLGASSNLLISGAIQDYSGGSSATPTKLTVNFNGPSSTLELSGTNNFGSGTTTTITSGTSSGTLIFGNDSALGNASTTIGGSAGTDQQIIIMAADTKSTDTLSTGITGQIVSGSITESGGLGIGGSGNLQFNGTVNMGWTSSSAQGIILTGTGTTIFHGTVQGSSSAYAPAFFGEGAATVIFDSSSTISGGYSGGSTGFIWADGAGTIKLSGVNGTNVASNNNYFYGGTVILDTSNSNNHLPHLGATSNLVYFGGVKLELDGGSNNQTPSSTTYIASGQDYVTSQNSNTAVLQLGTITESGSIWRGLSGIQTSTQYLGGGTITNSGQINFAAGTATTTTGSVGSLLLGGNATVGSQGSANFATVDSAVANHNIIAYSGATTLLTTGAGSPSTNYSLSGNATSSSTAYSANTLAITGTANNQTLTLGNTLTITSGGALLYSEGNTSNTYNYTVSGSNIGTTSGLFLVQQWGNGTLTIGSGASDGIGVGSGASLTTYLVKSGPGQLTLAGTNNTYTGATVVNSGILSISADNNLNAVQTGVFTITTATNGSKSVTGNTPATTTGFTDGATLTGVSGFSGQIVLAAGNGSGSVSTLSSAYTGSTGASSPTWYNDPGIILNGGTLQATSTFSLQSQYQSSGTYYNRSITLLTDNGTIDVTGSNTFTVGGVITGQGSLTKVDTGTLLLSGAYNSYDGGTYVNGGTLKFGVANSLDNTTAEALTDVMAVNAGTLDIAGYNENFGPLSLTGNGTVTDSVGGGVISAYSYNLQSGTVSAVLGDNTASQTFQSGSSYAAALVKNSDSGSAGTDTSTNGTVVLTKANTYTGGTTINSGTLLAENGSSGSATGAGGVQVNPGGILGGNGTIAPSSTAAIINIAAGGNLTPGVVPVGGLTTSGSALTVTNTNSIAGLLTFAATGTYTNSQLTFTLASGSGMQPSIGSLTFAGVSTYVALSTDVAGEVAFTGNSIQLNGLSSAAAGNYLLFQSVANGSNANNDYSGLTLAASANPNAPGYAITGLNLANATGDSLYVYEGDLYVNVQSVPEPGTTALLVMGGLLLVAVHRYRGALKIA